MTDTVEAPAPQKIAYMITADRVSFVLNQRARSLLLKSEQGRKVVELLKTDPQDIEAIGELTDIPTWIAKQSHGRVTVDETERLRLDGKLIDYGLTGRITKIVEQGVSFTSLANFIERLSRNPDPSVAEDLYRFMEKGNLPLDPEGYVLGFKKVDDTYHSFYTGTDGKVCYAPGTSPSMPREACDPNRQRTCSRGLHVCSFEYLNFWYARKGRLLIVRVDPEHVTAIPMDHNDQKLRCCQLDVVGEIPEEDAKDHFQKIEDARYAPAPEGVEDDALELTDDMRYPTYDQSEGGTLPGGPATNDDGSTNGWVGNEWLPITPPEAIIEAVEGALAAEPATRLKLHAVPDDDVSEEFAAPVSVSEWAKRGYEAGETDGRKDASLEYPYEPSVEVPGEIEDDEQSRSAYSKAYVEGYDAGFRIGETNGPQADEDEAD
jgi:hypothetical protein